MVREEGYIKFNCHWIQEKAVSESEITEINHWRDLLYQKRLIGAYDDGVGFGNISIRHRGGVFLISGSATGNLKTLDANHYTIVNEYNLADNSLTCTGSVRASSESLSHAIIYECAPAANAVIHIHHLGLWHNLMNKVPTTRHDIPYGTPEMAAEIRRLFCESEVEREKIFVMGGHREGIITFGKTLEEAGRVLLNQF